LHFKRADVDATIHYAIETRSTLIKERRRRELGIARFNGRTARQQRVRKRWAAITLKWPKQRIGIDLIARARQITAGIIVADVVPVRDNGAVTAVDILPRSSSL
jgi:hypothetical protein